MNESVLYVIDMDGSHKYKVGGATCSRMHTDWCELCTTLKILLRDHDGPDTPPAHLGLAGSTTHGQHPFRVAVPRHYQLLKTMAIPLNQFMLNKMAKKCLRVINTEVSYLWGGRKGHTLLWIFRFLSRMLKHINTYCMMTYFPTGLRSFSTIYISHTHTAPGALSQGSGGCSFTPGSASYL